MTVTHERLTYRHWTGRTGELPSPSGWMDLGIVPIPNGRRATVRYHWHHGRLMGFPRLSVLAFCIRSLFRHHAWPVVDTGVTAGHDGDIPSSTTVPDAPPTSGAHSCRGPS